ncbi:MAG: DUF188 domain-containing protein [Spirochaetia bacterium]|jgi:uncharacterized protein YaiI (UPF0178 family)|nr:DUF188 domain-containing protein [Spirochaetia bacterium]
MTLWIDGDSLPRDLRALLLRRAGSSRQDRPFPELRFVSARKLPEVPPELCRIVQAGPDAADRFIEAEAALGDLVVTRDTALAERLADRGIYAINDRGDVFTNENAAERRSLRDATLQLRNLGLAPPSPRGSTRGPRELKRFADSLEALLTRLGRS